MASVFVRRCWCERCATCGEVTPHSRALDAWRVVAALVLGFLGARAFALQLGPGASLLPTVGALGFAFSAWRGYRAGACERCRWKRRKAARRTELDPRSTTTTIDF
ncbi:MAG: hypothetical protein IT453_00400 [Planctomycetes bacterium]|jgi:hypothetical protein|nr:hypothetical protein [Planctomycetota bacterium]